MLVLIRCLFTIPFPMSIKTNELNPTQSKSHYPWISTGWYRYMKRQVSSSVCLYLVQRSVPLVISTWCVWRKVTLFFTNWSNGLNVWGWKLYCKLRGSFYTNKKKCFKSEVNWRSLTAEKVAALRKLEQNASMTALSFLTDSKICQSLTYNSTSNTWMSNDTLCLENKQFEMPIQDSKCLLVLLFFFHSTFKGAGMSNILQLLLTLNTSTSVLPLNTSKKPRNLKTENRANEIDTSHSKTYLNWNKIQHKVSFNYDSYQKKYRKINYRKIPLSFLFHKSTW